jgi:hypothetical protein
MLKIFMLKIFVLKIFVQGTSAVEALSSPVRSAGSILITFRIATSTCPVDCPGALLGREEPNHATG